MRMRKFGEILHKVVLDVAKVRKNNKDTISCIETCFQKLNNAIIGFKKTKLYLIYGEKYQIVIDYIEKIINGISEDKKILYFTYVNDEETFVLRILAKRMCMPLYKIFTNTLTGRDWSDMYNVISTFNGENLNIVNSEFFNIEEMITMCKSVDVDLIIIDALSAISGFDGKLCYKKLKNLATKMNVQIIVLDNHGDDNVSAMKYFDCIIRISKNDNDVTRKFDDIYVHIEKNSYSKRKDIKMKYDAYTNLLYEFDEPRGYLNLFDK